MTVTAIGELALSVELPQVTAAFGSVLANVNAEVAALASFSVTPPSIQSDLDLLLDMLEGLLQAQLLGITPPSIDAQLSIVLAQLAELRIQLGLLNALSGTLAASAHLYTYAGTVAGFGTELDAEISGGLPGGSGADVAFGVVLVATAPAGVTALQSLFKTTP